VKAFALSIAVFGCALAIPAAAQPADRAASSNSPGKQARRSGVAQFRAGATYRRLYDIPIFAGEFGAALGSWDERRGKYLAVNFIAPGRTENGLSLWGVSAGLRANWQLSDVRLGLHAGLEYLEVDRATYRSTLASLGFALAGFVGWDFLHSEAGVVGVDLALNADPFFGHDTALFWGPTLGLHYRI
jgi:hypothetical protein